MKKLVLQFTYCLLVRNFLKLVIGVKMDSSAFLKKEKQFILVANHNSHLDTLALMSSLPADIIHRVKPVAAKDYFGKTKFLERFSNYFINALLIERTKEARDHDHNPINQMIAELDKGNSLILFPEGTRGTPEKMQPMKKGVGIVLAQRPHVKFVPAYLRGMGKALPKGDRVILPYESSLTFGAPTSVEGMSAEEILKLVEKKILLLAEEQHPGS